MEIRLPIVENAFECSRVILVEFLDWRSEDQLYFVLAHAHLPKVGREPHATGVGTSYLLGES